MGDRGQGGKPSKRAAHAHREQSASRPHAGSGAVVLCHVVEFLKRKRLQVPAALLAACPEHAPHSAAGPNPTADSSPEFKWALTLLADLKERERRALVRFVQRAGDGARSRPAAERSDSAITKEPCSESDDDEGGPAQLPGVRGGEWPPEVTYTNDYAWGDDVSGPLAAKYRPNGFRRRASRQCPRTYSAVITEASHPAAGELGLFAALDMPHGAWVLDYVGAVSLGENEDKTSDYVCDFGESSELALDAKLVGNEARFVNDYRNTGRRASVEFRLRRDRRGELRQGIFVCAKEGVKAGEELLISYGKPFWRARVGNLEDFIVRRPGQ
jgi:hypothetical protein